MNHWLMEIVAKDEQEEVQRAMRQIHLEQSVRNDGMDYSTAIGRSLILLGLWLVTFGRHLQKRYAQPWINVSSTQHRLSAWPR